MSEYNKIAHGKFTSTGAATASKYIVSESHEFFLDNININMYVSEQI